MDAIEILREELEYYELNKTRLLAKHEGRFVLIHGEELDVYDSEDEAVAEGYRRYMLAPFLVKQIVEVDVPLTLVNASFALDDD